MKKFSSLFQAFQRVNTDTRLITLVALAALAATGAFAQSSVTITGGFDAGLRMSDIKGATVNQIVGNNSYTSNVTFKGTEDLGGGLSANFQYEIDPVATLTAGAPNGSPTSADNSNVSNVGNGQSFVGLKSNSAGEIQFGTINTATLDANGMGQPFGTAIGSGYKIAAIAATRYQQTFAYVTPSAAGFSGKLLYGFKDDKQNNAAASGVSGTTGSMPLNGRDQIQELSLKYANGPLNLIYVNLQTKSYATAGSLSSTACTAVQPTAVATTVAPSAMTDGGAGNTCADGNAYKVNTFAGNYTMGALTGYGWYQTQKADGQTSANPAALTSSAPLATVDRTAKGIAAKYQVSSPLSLQIGLRQITRNAGESYNASVTGGNVASAGIGQTTKVTALGADYELSKRTAVYFRYESINDDAILSNTRGAGVGSGYTGADQGTGKITNTAFGIRHTF